jgi:hypothetical protein
VSGLNLLKKIFQTQILPDDVDLAGFIIIFPNDSRDVHEQTNYPLMPLRLID